jgi:uncharacterized protein YkwD
MNWLQQFLWWFRHDPIRYPSQGGPIAPFSELDLIRKHNVERIDANVGQLRTDPKLSAMASVRANHAASARLAPTHLHDGFEGVAGSSASAENAAIGQPDAASVMASWMFSPGHRANILDPQFNRMGAGRAVSQDSVAYWFCVFAG